MDELHELSAVTLAGLLQRGDVTPREAAAHFLARIARADDALGAFVEVTAERALRRAGALGAPDPSRPLWGMPLADKDLTARAGVPTRYGSRAFASYVPEHSDPLARALDDLGAVSLGKTNTPEFGMTGYTESRVAPPARNPWDTTTGAGGSSGGAAAAVAAGLLPAAPASDGGGSIRIPAATVGVVGLKPSRGRLPVGSGMDAPGGLSVAGPIARTVEDAAFLLDALAASGPYPYATRAPGSGPFHDAARRGPGRLRVGATTVTPWDGWTDTTLDPGARAAFDAGVRLLEAAGHDVADAGWRPRGYPALFATIWRASAARIPVADERLDDLLEPLTAWLVREGRALPAERVLAAYAEAAVFERETISAFSPFDVVVTPALALSPRPVGWYPADDPERNFAQQCRYAPHTSFVNVAGLPAITVPLHPDATGRPVSVQLIGRPGGEAVLLSLAAQLEAARGPLPHPPVW
ncbi:amidase [Microbacterium betulae]|uniref:Amidase n=1 Tax=Microbacterium betulae TaxID=2981139 RepID=A0AA97FG93_9MICO|nr:amidase [Microbacterium sp. AB]WOF22113.1 amidase [Microbacterium sp. AB]